MVSHWNANCLINSSFPLSPPLPCPSPSTQWGRWPQPPLSHNAPQICVTVQCQTRLWLVIMFELCTPHCTDLPFPHPNSSLRGPGPHPTPLLDQVNHHLLQGPHIPLNAQQGLPSAVLYCKGLGMPPAHGGWSYLLSWFSQSQHQDSSTCPPHWSNPWTSWQWRRQECAPPAPRSWKGLLRGESILCTLGWSWHHLSLLVVCPHSSQWYFDISFEESAWRETNFSTSKLFFWKQAKKCFIYIKLLIWATNVFKLVNSVATFTSLIIQTRFLNIIPLFITFHCALQCVCWNDLPCNISSRTFDT